MFDPTSISTIISTDWTETNPAAADISFVVDEFDPRVPELQVLIVNLDSKSTHISGNLFRKKQTVKVTLYLKPVKYDVDVISAAKAIFYNTVAEIDRIFQEGRHDGSTEYNLEGWIMESMPHGLATQVLKPEPLILQASQNIVVDYYSGEM